MKPTITKSLIIFLLFLISLSFVSCEKEYELNLTGDVIITYNNNSGPSISNPKLYVIGDLTTPLIESLGFDSDGVCKIEGLNFGNYCFEYTRNYEAGPVTNQIVFQIRVGETTKLYF